MQFTTLELGLIASLFLSVVALMLAILSLRATRAQKLSVDRLLQKISRDVAASTDGSVGVGQRLLAIEKRLHAPEKPNQTIDYYNDESFQPYSQAAQLFGMGLDTEEVARRCGLSRAEVSLIQMMQINAKESK
jgi:hypothetical protein